MRRSVQASAGLLVAAGLVWLLFRGTDWAALAAALAGVDPVWVLVSQAALWGSQFTRVQRWAYVVRAAHAASFRHLLAATQVGFLVNFTIPARLGELVRALLLTRLAGAPLPRSLAMVALDRVTDLIGLLAVLLVAALALASEREVQFAPGTFGNTEALVVSSAVVRAAGVALGALVALALAGLAILYVWRERAVRLVEALLRPVSSGLAARVSDLLAGFAEGMHVFRSRGDLARAIVWSLVTWGANVVGLAAILAAFSIDFPWYAPFLMLALIAAAIAVPIAPGAVGQYHVPAVAALLMAAPEVAPARAKAVAIVAHLSALVPIGGLGLYCLFREDLRLGELLRRARREGGAAEQPLG